MNELERMKAERDFWHRAYADQRDATGRAWWQGFRFRQAGVVDVDSIAEAMERAHAEGYEEGRMTNYFPSWQWLMKHGSRNSDVVTALLAFHEGNCLHFWRDEKGRCDLCGGDA